MGGETEATSDYEEDPADLTLAVANARRGFRRDVGTLVLRVAQGKFLVPLLRRVDGAAIGEEREMPDELSLSPHLLFDRDRTGYVALFTRPELVARATERLGWQTDGGPLEYCTLQGRVALELAVALVDDARIRGVVVNAFDATELVLRRHEVASIAQGKAVPLVGYVAEIPPGDDEERLVAEMPAPPPAEVVRAIEAALSAFPAARGYRLHSTFNPERDLEPHLTLNVLAREPGAARDGPSPVDEKALSERVASELEGKLPPPGYIDIVFDDPALA